MDGRGRWYRFDKRATADVGQRLPIDFENWFGGDGGWGDAPSLGTVADVCYLAANGEKESAAFLEVATPDKVQG